MKKLQLARLTPTQRAHRQGFLEGIHLAVEVLANVTCALALYALVQPLHPLPGEDEPDEPNGPRNCKHCGARGHHAMPELCDAPWCIDNAGHEGPHYYGSGIGDEPNDGTHPVRQDEPEDEAYVPTQREGSDDL